MAGEIDSYTIENRFVRKDRGYTWVEVTSSSVRNAADEFFYAVRVQHDIAARKQAEYEIGRRMKEQAALRQFSECLQHVNSAEEVHDVALEAIMRALDCERASILLFNNKDVMRFVTRRGLSQDYRKAVEGHSPWSKNEKSPKLVLVEDVSASKLPAPERGGCSRGDWSDPFHPDPAERQARRQVCRLLRSSASH